MYKDGVLPLTEFMKMPYTKDILVKVSVKKAPVTVSYQMLRNAEADFPIVNLALSKDGGRYSAAVGARPGRAVLALETAGYLTRALEGFCGQKDFKDVDEIAARAGEILKGEVCFGSNMRAGAAYREKIAKVLLKRAIREVEGC